MDTLKIIIFGKFANTVPSFYFKYSWQKEISKFIYLKHFVLAYPKMVCIFEQMKKFKKMEFLLIFIFKKFKNTFPPGVDLH